LSRRLLIVKLGDLGDAVILTAAVDAASSCLPEYSIDVLLGSAGGEVFACDERVNKVITFDRKLIEGIRAFTPRSIIAWIKLLWSVYRRHYDIVIFAHHMTTFLGTLKLFSIALASGASLRAGIDNGRGWFLNASLPDQGFGAKCEGAYWRDIVLALAPCASGGNLGIKVCPESYAKADSLLGNNIARPLIAVHHGLGGWIPGRAWRAELYAKVIDRLHQLLGGSFILIGGPEEVGGAEEIIKASRTELVNLVGKTSVQVLAAVLSRCDLYIGPDSGPMHVAEAVGTKIVSLWGPTNERAWGPCEEIGAPPSVCIRAPNRPKPSLYVGHKMGNVSQACDLGDIDPESVVDAAIRLLRSGGKVGCKR